MALKYFKRYHTGGKADEITYEQALNTLLNDYRDNDMTRDMLTIPNNIRCTFSWVYVEEDKGDGMRMCLMPGLQNDLPFGVEYDEEGNRI